MSHSTENVTCEPCSLRGYTFCHRPEWHRDLASGINAVEDALTEALKRAPQVPPGKLAVHVYGKVAYVAVTPEIAKAIEVEVKRIGEVFDDAARRNR